MCSKFPKEAEKYLEVPGLHWYCTLYDHSRLQALESKFDRVIESTENNITDLSKNIATSLKLIERNLEQAIDSRLKPIRESLNEVVTKHSEPTKTYAEIAAKLDSTMKQNQTIQYQVSKQITNIQTELTSDKRAKNLVIFGIKEKGEIGTGSDIVSVLSEVLTPCGIKNSFAKDQVMRLGERKEGRARPVRVCLKTEADKWELLKRINANKPAGVFARLDLCKEEQERDFHLRTELKKVRAEDTKNSYKIIRGKITKIQNHQTQVIAQTALSSDSC
jgi:hypothetical protein